MWGPPTDLVDYLISGGEEKERIVTYWKAPVDIKQEFVRARMPKKAKLSEAVNEEEGEGEEASLRSAVNVSSFLHGW